MKILSIDPGPEISAFVLWDTKKHNFIGHKMGIETNESLVSYHIDWFKEQKKNNLSFKEMIVNYHIDKVAIEMIQSYGNPLGRESLETILWIGRFAENMKIRYNDIKISLYARPTIKGQVGGRNDTQIRASLRERYGEARKGCFLEGVKKDIWSALALAVALEENPNLKEWVNV